VIITQALLQRHQGTMLCKGCGEPLKEGENVARRRVNSRARYFHWGCIYTEARETAEEAEG